MIVARHEDNVVMVFLGGYDLDHGIATVNVKDFPDLDAVVFRSRMTFPPLTNVVALGRDNFGKLLSTRGVLKFETGRAFPSHIMSTCKISKEYEGGPLFYVHGNFLGMNLSACTEGTFCLPEITLSEQWINIIWLEDKSPAYLNSFKIRTCCFAIISRMDVCSFCSFSGICCSSAISSIALNKHFSTCKGLEKVPML